MFLIVDFRHFHSEALAKCVDIQEELAFIQFDRILDNLYNCNVALLESMRRLLFHIMVFLFDCEQLF